MIEGTNSRGVICKWPRGWEAYAVYKAIDRTAMLVLSAWAGHKNWLPAGLLQAVQRGLILPSFSVGAGGVFWAGVNVKPKLSFDIAS